ncbi:zinc-binding dehydrogenase [Rhizomonospora bruguierae]|uniref:zinc-binding dehydrogenase n=1 Tax=Rhizomonospora bruguierae TaxID=1581705 RepID=UPI001BCCE41C|nr:zinc-binding dehydrogenase [Micromonospora sp. NBRC 107566]
MNVTVANLSTVLARSPGRRVRAVAVGAAGPGGPARRHRRGVLAGAEALPALLALTDGGFEATMDCSGSVAGRALAVRAARRYGRCVLVGEGGRLELDASPDVIHQQLRIEGSWVTSTWRLRELVDNLARWQLHPEVIVTGRYGLGDAAAADEEADAGVSGKVGIVS